MRNARRLDNGHFLVAHYGPQCVTEYDMNGKVVWNLDVPGGPHSLTRLSNGHTLIAVADLCLFVQFRSHMHAVAGKGFGNFVRRSASSLRLSSDFRFRTIHRGSGGGHGFSSE